MSESQVALVYGPAKKGKTTDLGFSFPTGIFFAPSHSSVMPLRKVVGIKPKIAVVKNLDPVVKFVKAHANDESISAVVVDDIALLGDESIKTWKLENAGWYAYQRIIETIQEICVIARHSPWHLIIDSHERPPVVDEATGVFVQGGPTLPGKKAAPAIEKNASMLLRVMTSDGITDDGASDPSWPIIYSCDPADAQYITGDRNGVALPKNPMNLRELLKAGGVDLPRTLEWQEEMVDKLSSLALSGKLNEDTLTSAETHMRHKLKASELDITWTLRDARARAWFASHSNARLANTRASLLAANVSV